MKFIPLVELWFWRRAASNRRRQFHDDAAVLADRHASNGMTRPLDGPDGCGYIPLAKG
jgi:hypothetical protein